MQDLSGKVAIVFGASRGIGEHTARRLAKAGAAVVVSSRNIAACEIIEAEIVASGGRARSARLDVSDYGEVANAVDLALEAFGALDIVVNNAGVIEPIQLIAECDVKAWADNIKTNVVGVLHGCRAALPAMLAQRRGVIVNVSSGAASAPLEGWSAYCAGKAAIAMLTSSLHLEYASGGIRAYGFRPGLVDTAMQATIRQSGINRISSVPQSSLIPASEPADAIAWLCTEEASDLAGNELDIRDPEFRRRSGL